MKNTPASYKSQKIILSSIIYFFMILFTIVALVPIWLMLINATRNNAEINAGISMIPSVHALDNWKILTNRNFKLAVGFKNSLIISCGVTFKSLFISSDIRDLKRLVFES